MAFPNRSQAASIIPFVLIRGAKMAAGNPRLSIVAPRPRSPEEKARGLAAKADVSNSPTVSPTAADKAPSPCSLKPHSIEFYRALQDANIGGFETLRAAFQQQSAVEDLPVGSSLHEISINISDMIDSSQPEYKPQYQYTVTGRMRKKAQSDRPQLGIQVHVNHRDLTLFRYKEKVFAMDAKCPHAGGTLALGDIEDMDGHVCVACPVHGFMFALDAGGVSVVPEGTFTLQLYPTRVAEDGTVSVALPNAIEQAAFTDDDF